jgi:hypothetical protein
MGASKKKQMRYFDKDWADQIWDAAREIGSGKGAAWLRPLAAIALTGARPAALEKGIEFSIVNCAGVYFIQAMIPGVKLRKDRGQPHHLMRWSLDKITTHRKHELKLIAETLLKAESNRILIQYDAEAISTRLRELSISIWPRKKHHITAYCYRQLFAGAAKSSGANRDEIALAMGHLSADSQGRYSRKSCGGRKPDIHIKPWAEVGGPKPIKPQRSALSRFKNASRKKTGKEFT